MPIAGSEMRWSGCRVTLIAPPRCLVRAPFRAPGRSPRIAVAMDAVDVDRVLLVARESARQAGEIIRVAFDQPKRIDSKKNDVDLVTVTDQQCERVIMERIQAEFPGHKFIGEEQAAALGSIPELTDEPTWLVDPLDGTTNFVHSFPFVCVCIGFAVSRRVEVGVVFNPVLGEMFEAVRGRGATLNGRPISCSAEPSLSRALVGTELGVGREAETVEAVFDRIRRVSSASRSIRCGGSCAMGLCGVATGRLDAFYEIGFGGPWDVAAASLILTEAGGKVLDPGGGALSLTSRRVLGTNAHLAEQMAAVLSQAKTSQHEPQP